MAIIVASLMMEVQNLCVDNCGHLSDVRLGLQSAPIFWLSRRDGMTTGARMRLGRRRGIEGGIMGRFCRYK
jgi:hypothetical protein